MEKTYELTITVKGTEHDMEKSLDYLGQGIEIINLKVKEKE